MKAYALGYVARGWEAFPLNGKAPLGAAAPHGVLDATTDPAQIEAWWTRWPNANIGVRVPETLFVLDLDPRKAGAAEAFAELERINGPLPATLTAYSGRGDGGWHRYYLHPGGKLSSKRLPIGMDIKTSSGYVVVPPSVHPDSGQAYRWADTRPPVAIPAWLEQLLRPPAPTARPRRIPSPFSFSAIWDSIADHYSHSTTWHDVLTPHGWTCVKGDGDSDGSGWRHPSASTSCSATIKYGLLFVYSPNTPFEVTETEDPHGYTRFRAYAILEHGGDLSAAARALQGGAA